MSADTVQLFKRLLKEMRPLLKGAGFRASGQTFLRESNECWIIINFQKSRLASCGEITFYVNVAACTKRWSGFQSRPPVKAPPFFGCDWQWRVEHFGPDKTIKQWTLCDEDSFERTRIYLQGLFRQFVLPSTETMTTEAALLKHVGGFEYPQLKTRSVILAATGQLDGLGQTIATLIEKFGTNRGTWEHLKLLSAEYPLAMQNIEAVQHESSSALALM